jgi:hypothetical protein
MRSQSSILYPGNSKLGGYIHFSHLPKLFLREYKRLELAIEISTVFSKRTKCKWVDG